MGHDGHQRGGEQHTAEGQQRDGACCFFEIGKGGVPRGRIQYGGKEKQEHHFGVERHNGQAGDQSYDNAGHHQHHRVGHAYPVGDLRQGGDQCQQKEYGGDITHIF